MRRVYQIDLVQCLFCDEPLPHDCKAARDWFEKRINPNAPRKPRARRAKKEGK